MSKSNLIPRGRARGAHRRLAIQRAGDDEGTTGPAPRLFPEFNREAADGIKIEGGWKKLTYELARSGAGWVLRSGGDLPVKAGEVSKFLDAVANLRRDNLVGDSAELKKDTRTGGLGRVVTVMRGGEPMASFVLGKHPKGAWDSYFVRRSDEEKIYRTKTVDDNAVEDKNSFGSNSFDWAQYCNNAFKWAQTHIWSMDDGEVTGAWLERPGDMFSVQLNKKEEGAWALVETGKDGEKKADTAAVEDILGSLSSLAFEEVVGSTKDADARERYGLDQPGMTLILTLRKKVESKEEEGDEPKDGDEKEAKEPEYTEIKRTITVGKKMKTARSYDDEKGEATERELYAITVSGDLEDPAKANHIYLVDDYKVGPLKKSLEDLIVKEEPKEEPKDEEAPKDEETPKDEGAPKDEDAKEDETETPTDEPEDPKKPKTNRRTSPRTSN